MRVLFAGGGTGGHLYPALAIARALVRRRPDVRPHFVGALRGIEREVLPSTEFAHTLLDLHPLYRSAPWRNWRTMLGLARGMKSVAALHRVERVRLAVATGGYASGATLAFAALRGIPYALQEQNAFPGRTIVTFSRWAAETYLGFPEAVAGLPAAARARAYDLGNPIEPPSLSGERGSEDAALDRAHWGFGDAVRFVVLAFGGSQGSAALNRMIDAWITRGLPPGVGVIWGTGAGDYARYADRQSATVVVRAYLAPIRDAYAVAQAAVARAGAMTTAELCAWGIPMLLVPLPTAAADHQTANARTLAACGAAEWIAEAEASAEHVERFVRALSSDADLRQGRVRAARARARPDAAAKIAERLDHLLGSLT